LLGLLDIVFSLAIFVALGADVVVTAGLHAPVVAILQVNFPKADVAREVSLGAIARVKWFK